MATSGAPSAAASSAGDAPSSARPSASQSSCVLAAPVPSWTGASLPAKKSIAKRSEPTLRVLLPEEGCDQRHGGAAAARLGPAVGVPAGGGAVEEGWHRVRVAELVPARERRERPPPAVDADRRLGEVPRHGEQEGAERRVVRIREVGDRVLEAEKRLAGEGGDADLVGDTGGVAAGDQELGAHRALGLDRDALVARRSAGRAVDRERGERDGAGEPHRARGQIGEERLTARRDGGAERARVEHAGAVAARREADARPARRRRRRALAQREGRQLARRYVGQEVEEEPAHGAVGPALEGARLERRRAPVGRGEPERVGAAHAPAWQRYARARGPGVARHARALLERQRHGERGSGRPHRAGGQGESERERAREHEAVRPGRAS